MVSPISSSAGGAEPVLHITDKVFILSPFPGQKISEEGGHFPVVKEGDTYYFMDGSLKVLIPQQFVDYILELTGGSEFISIVLGDYKWAFDSNDVPTLVWAKTPTL